VHVQPAQLERRLRLDPLEQPGRVVERDAELRVRAAGVHRGVRPAGHRRVDAQEHGLRARSQPGEPLDVVGAVDHDQADAGIERGGDVQVGLRVAMQQDLGRVEPRRQRDRELAGGRDVAAQSFLREDAHDRRARQRLGGEVDLRALVSAAEGAQVLARGRAQALLVDDERRGAELVGDVRERTAADGQAPVVCRGGGAGEDVEQRHRPASIHPRTAARRGAGPRRSGPAPPRAGQRTRIVIRCPWTVHTIR
jgi:hypothetical protein